MASRIKEFQGEYRWLSNFWLCPIEYNGHVYKSVEHAYQASKATVESDRVWIANTSTPAGAKHKAKKIALRPEWNMIRVPVMYELVHIKFSSNLELRQKLLDTGDMILEEGNRWHDLFWGIDLDTGKGQNLLGKLIMQVRDELRKEVEE